MSKTDRHQRDIDKVFINNSIQIYLVKVNVKQPFSPNKLLKYKYIRIRK